MAELTIGVDLRQVAPQISGGVVVHVKGVLEPLFALHPECEFVVFNTVFNQDLFQNPPGNVRFETLSLFSYFDDLDRLMDAHEADVLFRSGPMNDPLRFPTSRQIVFVPDLQHAVFPQFFSQETLQARRAAFGRAIREAGAIGVSTNHQRDHIRQRFPDACEDIFLMSPAVPVDRRQYLPASLTPAELDLIPEEDFFLFPANLWPHKNHRLALRAFELFLEQTGRRMRFILTGYPKGWSKMERRFRSVPVQHLGYVSSPILRALYERALALVYFSLYEGFGIPLLEAFDAGTPVICSNTNSLPEVGGNAVLSCDPTDVAAMAGLMRTIVEDGEVRDKLISRGKARLSRYSWEESAQNLFGALRRVASSAP